MNSEIHPKLEELVRDGLKRDASDLFLIPGEPPALRRDGKIERLDAETVSPELVEQIAVMAVGTDSLKRIGPEVGEIQKTCALPGEANVTLTIGRAAGKLTITAQLSGPLVLSVEDTRFPQAMVEAACSPTGLLVLCGRLGSGVHTAAYSLLDHLNATNSCHICTVEGPSLGRITPKKALVQQREIGVDVPDCLSGIQAAMRQDLDVLMVRGLRSAEEMQACLTAAETGHLVILILNVAVQPEGVIERIAGVFPDDVRETARKTLASVLRGVSSQRLVKRVGGGRTAVYGVLIPDEKMREDIAAGRDLSKRKTPAPGCRTMAEDVEQLRADGIISEEMAREALQPGPAPVNQWLEQI
jgi:twitching motility protein PilT